MLAVWLISLPFLRRRFDQLKARVKENIVTANRGFTGNDEKPIQIGSLATSASLCCGTTKCNYRAKQRP